MPVNFNLVALSGISCNNVNDPPCDGFIEMSFSGGTLPYTSIEWFGETAPGSGIFTVGPFINTDNPLQILNACEGRYHLEVIDANGCQYISDPYIIEQFNTPITLLDTVSNFNGFNIDCNGAIRESRYRHTKSGRYDGIHLYGSSGLKTYTLSVLNILRAANITSSEDDFHQSCAQFKYQSRQKRHSNYRQTDRRTSQTGFSLPVSSRFDLLSNTNQGNA